MSRPDLFVREAGQGPTVLCCHSNAGSSSQWRGLMEAMAPTHRVLAVDHIAAGRSAPWREARRVTLADEVDALAPVLERAGPRFSLVGHSYGAAVALIAALRHPRRVRSMVLYEPTLFALIDAEGPPPNDADRIRATVAASTAALERGDTNEAARHFIDYWMAPGAWQATPPERQAQIAEASRQMPHWAHALMTEPTPAAAFGALTMPVLLMTGGRSTAAAHGVAHRLRPHLPAVQTHDFEALGHMGPVTHPSVVNPVIAEFLAAH